MVSYTIETNENSSSHEPYQFNISTKDASRGDWALSMVKIIGGLDVGVSTGATFKDGTIRYFASAEDAFLHIPHMISRYEQRTALLSPIG